MANRLNLQKINAPTRTLNVGAFGFFNRLALQDLGQAAMRSGPGEVNLKLLKHRCNREGEKLCRFYFILHPSSVHGRSND